MLLAFIIVSIIVIVYLWRRHTYINIDGQQFAVLQLYDNYEDAAKYFSDVNTLIMRFLRYLKFKYKADDVDLVGDASNTREYIVARILDNYDPSVVHENQPKSSETSYTIGKGASMAVCIRHLENPAEFASKNTVLFVMLHEIAHIGNLYYGHNYDFWEVFKFILREAVSAGVYDPVDYSVTPVRYCGMVITSNPLFSDSIRDI